MTKCMKYISLLLLIGLYALVTYWLWWPYTIMEIQQPIKVINPDRVAYAGEEFIYELHYSKTTPLSAMVSKNLINDYIITLTPISGNLPAGENLTKKISVNIPGYACPGKYRLRWVAHYKVNPLRIIQVEAWSEEFTVLRRD